MIVVVGVELFLWGGIYVCDFFMEGGGVLVRGCG